MRLEDVLRQNYILPNLNACEKRDVLEEMVKDIASKGVVGLCEESLLEVILEREKLGSTGIGYGVAIPHAKVKGLNSVIVSFARSRKGVDFQATDDKPVHLFFLILAPENSTATHLKILSDISRLLMDSSVRKNLVNARDEAEIYKIILEAERKF